ncbi:YwqG family protein [Paludifilum halophilum]|nr:YwqG family protein [Paludifilum halophilum]
MKKLPIENQIKKLLKDNDLSDMEEDILETLIPCIAITPVEADDLPVGTSKFGGFPDLPEGEEFPRWKGRPLSFIAQYNLAELKQTGFSSPLPDQGMLYFFCGTAMDIPVWEEKGEPGGWSVFYIDTEPSRLRPVPFPEDLPREGFFEERKMKLSVEKTLPEVEFIEGMDDVYFDLMDQLYQLEERESGYHQAFGDPFQMEGDVFKECKANSGNPSDDWVLLLQVDSDEEMGMIWGDLGMLYFCIAREDLRKKRFDRSWLVMQSH